MCRLLAILLLLAAPGLSVGQTTDGKPPPVAAARWEASPGHHYGAMARYKLTLVRRQKLIEAHGTAYERPEDAAISSVEVLPSGAELYTYSLSEGHRAYIESFDVLMRIDFAAELEAIRDALVETEEAEEQEELESIATELAQIEEILRTNQGAITYEVARLLFNHAQYDEARERFFEIIEKWPEQMVANYSAHLILDSYSAQEDLEALRTRIRCCPPYGQPSQPPEGSAVFKHAGDFARQAIEARRDGDEAAARSLRIQAAEAYLALTETYTEESEIHRKAFYNVGQSYAEAGDYETANRYFKQYVDRFPDDELSFPLTFRIALNYASMLNVEEAVKYFEQLYDSAGKDYADAPTALYNAAFLRIGLGDHRGAAENFEQYARAFPTLSDAESVMFGAGAQWEKVSDAEAIAFYRRYLARHQARDPDHMVEARYRIAALLRAGSREAEAAWDDLTRDYHRYREHIGPAGRHYAAMAEVGRIQRQLSASPARSPEALAALEARSMALIAEYQDFESTTAALHIAGSAYLTTSPDSAFAEHGRRLLEDNLRHAAEAHRWSPWLSETEAALAEHFPETFVVGRPELRASTDGDTILSAGPLPVLKAR